MPAAVEGSAARAEPQVTAILVSHDGARWLPQVIDGLQSQRRPPAITVAVDTGSTDGSAVLLADRLGRDHVLQLRRSTGFGAAVTAALSHVDTWQGPTHPANQWVWLLHDDSAPEPDALDGLLQQVGRDVAVVGPKLREWPSLRRLLEVGVTISGTGNRETSLERGEPDQGQHDWPRDVLAVNTAGMLVRRDVWEQLGGLDPQLPLFGDDLDFGWRVARAGYRTRVAPEAVVFHAEAASRGLRSIDVRSSWPRATPRRGSLFTLLANASRPGFWWQSVRLLWGSVLRVLALLLAKAPAEAWDEVRSAAGVYLHPFAMLRARRRRHRSATRSPAYVRQLLPSPMLPYRHGVDAVLDLGLALFRAAGGTGGQPQTTGKRAVVESGPVATEAEELPTTSSVLVRVLRQPWPLIVLMLFVLSLWSARGLLGGGQLSGGALLPAPDGVGAWWGLAWEAWHPVGIGSDSPAAPYVVGLALAGTVTFGQPWLLVDLVVLAAVPLCALTARHLARRIFASTKVVLWWSVAYALLPVVVGAVGQGRIGTLVGLVVLPFVASAALSLLAGGGPLWQHAVRLGVWLAVLVAFVPLAYLLVAVVLAVAIAGVAPLGVARSRVAVAAIGAMAVPWVILGRWMWDRAVDPSGLWWEAGRLDARANGGSLELTPDWLELAGGVPGGPGHAPWWVGLLLVAAGVIALGRRDRSPLIATAWLVAATGLAAAVLGAGQRIELATGDGSAWTGFALAGWLAGLATAAALAADGIGDYLAAHSFGWRQPVAVSMAAVAATFPLLGIAWWFVSDDTTLGRDDPVPLPAYLSDQAASADQSATLLLAGSVDRGVGYQIIRDDGLRLGEESVLATRAERAPMNQAVVDLMSHPDSQAVGYLVDHGIGAIYAAPPVDDLVESALDGGAGLVRAGTTDPRARAWQVAAPSGAVRLVRPGGATSRAEKVEVVDASATLTGEMVLPDGSATGCLQLAAPASDRWSATGPDGPLEPAPAPNGTQGFAVSDGGPVTVEYSANHRPWLWGHAAAALVAVVLALPGRRRIG